MNVMVATVCWTEPAIFCHCENTVDLQKLANLLHSHIVVNSNDFKKEEKTTEVIHIYKHRDKFMMH